jgi:predicted tellurium resistance membrane protein TerC
MSLSDPQIWLSFLTLLVMELVLGIDNIVFISLLSNELPLKQQKRSRILGITLALVLRILMLTMISWVMSLTQPFINLAEWFDIHGGPGKKTGIVWQGYNHVGRRAVSHL